MKKGEDENRELEDLFLREKPAKILIALKTAKNPLYATLLSKDADCTYSHTIKILDVMERTGLVEFSKEGRIKTVTLTNSGWDIAHNMEAMRKKLVEMEENVPKKAASKKTSSRKKRKKGGK